MEQNYPKSTTVKHVEQSAAGAFLDAHHAPAMVVISDKTINLGLWRDEELVAVAQFGKPNTAQSAMLYDVEILRLGISNAAQTADGAAQLITEYQRIYSPSDILACQDTVKLFSEVYESCGFVSVHQADKTTYEWINPNRTFYTYRITATDSEKHYIGVSHVKQGNASVEDCLNDGYMGTGDPKAESNKFCNWKRRHKEKLVKEIISLHGRKSEAYEKERLLVGNSWRSDPLCLNSSAGGVRSGMGVALSQASRRTALCEVHGETSHQGSTCNRCALTERDKINLCESHGLVIHRGSKCVTCIVESRITENVCALHGNQKFLDNVCYRCLPKNVSLRECPTHGVTNHRGESCDNCTASKATTLQECPTHGIAKHRGEVCQKCTTAKGVNIATCEIHGVSNFQGKSCRKCASEKTAHTRYHKIPKPDCRFCS